MKQNTGVIRFGGIALILSGILFLAQYLFLLPMPSPPLTDAELMAWLQNWRFHLSMADELLFFATLLLIPSIVALYRVLLKVEPIKASLGCGLLAVVIPVHLFLVIILGRLVYPVYELELPPDIYKLVLSIYHGGMHSAALILGAAVIVLCFVIRKSVIGKPVAYLGFMAGVLELVSSYPWLIGTPLMVLCQLFFSAWLVLLGVRMLGRLKEAMGA
ncbi:hypothetical protein [Paenibacillus jilunlii]|uniref:DUF4386 domain-containing protein n=1 Tax=Paenibacillus jilunlii TaxID=682956 RepID=A0A1G9NHA0_9BACL|nr:hypothetical protein [Paenibacillus jilunlii]KWX79039.1 hypothetical protein AML91_03740 [Paenibacillus jilunlii]SDL85315.1 hypothetical protein SAMN05216191_106170 [Paenibacillus jilunlii]